MNPEYLKVRDLLEGLQKCDPDSCVKVGHSLVLYGVHPVTVRAVSYPFLVTNIGETFGSHRELVENCALDDVRDLCDEFEESEGDMSITEFIARLRKAAK